MNYRQNERINQITQETLIIGVDIAKFYHVARALDDRGIDLSKKITFRNSLEGFLKFEQWIAENQAKNKKSKVVIGMEPTGHYWENLARYLRKKQYPAVIVNTLHVYRSKELDDNNQTKTDAKDAKIIANLVRDGRYSHPNLLEGAYADLREAMNGRNVTLQSLQQVKNKLHRWYDRYFPEYKQVYKSCDTKGLLHIISLYGLPHEIAEKDPIEIFESLEPKYRRAIGQKRILSLHGACKKSIGYKESNFAKKEFQILLNTYHFYQEQMQEIEDSIEEISHQIKEIKTMMEMKGMALISASSIIAELGDIRKYKDPRQLCKMAGLSLKEHSSGLKKGKTTISRRGRSVLRQVLYKTVMSLIKNNKVFKELHHYYKTRAKNQLTGKASIIALCRKLLRILFAVVHKEEEYNEEKMRQDIIHPKEFLVNAA